MERWGGGQILNISHAQQKKVKKKRYDATKESNSRRGKKRIKKLAAGIGLKYWVKVLFYGYPFGASRGGRSKWGKGGGGSFIPKSLIHLQCAGESLWQKTQLGGVGRATA